MRIYLFIAATSLIAASASAAKAPVFPFYPPEEMPDAPLSLATERYYTAYEGKPVEDNELSTQFKYTELKGFDYNGYNGTRNRRDPSKVIKVNGKYYVWYTHTNSDRPNNGVPNADVWYATSTDGFTWEEQGPAVSRPKKPEIGWSSVLTPDILVWKGKYYLYYQAFGNESGNTKSNPVLVSYADSPDGPWKAHKGIVIPKGKEGEWDQHCIHDPYPLVHKGKIYLYYKSDFAGSSHHDFIRMQGLAIAEDPLGPFKKHPKNPVINSGHETTLFPFREGLAALLVKDGNERFTIQYAEDWVNFGIASTSYFLPQAGGPYVPDAFTDTEYGRGITWGLCFANPGNGGKGNILLRFDCDLSLDVDDPIMKGRHPDFDAEFLYQFGLTEEQREERSK
ncbi:MAG: glycoside hydrolase family 117 protein [Puniceicoccaceae bacterium]